MSGGCCPLLEAIPRLLAIRAPFTSLQPKSRVTSRVAVENGNPSRDRAQPRFYVSSAEIPSDSGVAACGLSASYGRLHRRAG